MAEKFVIGRIIGIEGARIFNNNQDSIEVIHVFLTVFDVVLQWFYHNMRDLFFIKDKIKQVLI